MVAAKKIAACICTYNRYDLLPKAIESIARQTLDAEQYQILVIDNSPDAGTAKSHALQYRKIPNLEYHIEKTPGLSNARNVGANMAQTTYIAYMDDDAIAAPDWLEKILAAFESFGEDTAIVGGRVDPLWDIARPEWVDNSMLGYLSVVDWGGSTRVANPGEWLAGTNVAFRTADVLGAGGFDVTLGRIGAGQSLLSNEEIAVVAALKEQGKLAVYAPEARVSHLVDRRRLTKSWMRKRVAWQAVSDFLAEPAQSVEKAKGYWNPISEYFFSLRPADRTIRGLFVEPPSSREFRRQLDAVYLTTAATLAGFEGVEDER